MKVLYLLLVLLILFAYTCIEVLHKRIIENRTIITNFTKKLLNGDFYNNSYVKVQYISKLCTLILIATNGKPVFSSQNHNYKKHSFFYDFEQELYPISHDNIYITCSLWKRFILLNYLLYHH